MATRFSAAASLADLPRPHERHTPAQLRERIDAFGEAPDACLICGADELRKLLFRDGKWFWMCKVCEFVWVHDIYPEFVDLSPDTPPPAFKQAPGAKDRADFEQTLRRIESVRQRNRLLELGCASGLFMQAAREAGWQPTGIEIEPQVAQATRDQRGLDVRTGEIFDADLEDGEFDVVYSNEVIEHVVEPLALMREVHRVLRPGGMALMRTGNARSWVARLRGADWNYYRFAPANHIRYWSPRAGRALAKSCGLELVAAPTRGFAFRESREVRGRWYRPLLTLAQAPLSPLAGWVGAGHRMTLILRRPHGD
jgi:2-polyprenyl-3-methyl-5-hydroxy-6-metoxy-1,4-benzoquinol methylase